MVLQAAASPHPHLSHRLSLIARAEPLEARAAEFLREARIIVGSIPPLDAAEAEASLRDDDMASASDWLKVRRADARRPCERVTAKTLSRRLWHFYYALAVGQCPKTFEFPSTRKYAVADLRFACDWLVAFPAPAYREEFRVEWLAERGVATRQLFDRGLRYDLVCAAPRSLSVRLALAAVIGRPTR